MGKRWLYPHAIATHPNMAQKDRQAILNALIAITNDSSKMWILEGLGFSGFIPAKTVTGTMSDRLAFPLFQDRIFELGIYATVSSNKTIIGIAFTALLLLLVLVVTVFNQLNELVDNSVKKSADTSVALFVSTTKMLSLATTYRL